jgi:hypothetical protein
MDNANDDRFRLPFRSDNRGITENPVALRHFSAAPAPIPPLQTASHFEKKSPAVPSGPIELMVEALWLGDEGIPLSAVHRLLSQS